MGELTGAALVNAGRFFAELKKTQRWELSLRDVSTLAGVSHNAPYSHFASKEELLAGPSSVNATGSFGAPACFDCSAVEKTKPADGAERQILIAYLRFGTGNVPGAYRLMFGPGGKKNIAGAGRTGGFPPKLSMLFTFPYEAVYRRVI